MDCQSPRGRYREQGILTDCPRQLKGAKVLALAKSIRKASGAKKAPLVACVTGQSPCTCTLNQERQRRKEDTIGGFELEERRRLGTHPKCEGRPAVVQPPVLHPTSHIMSEAVSYSRISIFGTLCDQNIWMKEPIVTEKSLQPEQLRRSFRLSRFDCNCLGCHSRSGTRHPSTAWHMGNDGRTVA